nr:hypothetical protein [Tanacetum cinerariifolium]
MGRDIVQLETAVNTISQEYLLEFTSDYGISEALYPELPGPEDKIVDFPEGKVGVHKRGHDGADANAPPKVLRRDHVNPRPTGSTHGGKSLAAIELGMASTRPVPVPENAPADMSDPDPLSFADPRSRHPTDGTAAAGDLESGNASFASAVRSPESIYRPEWGVANGSMLDTPEACQDLVDHVAPLGYFSELCHLHNNDFLRQYNVNLAPAGGDGIATATELEAEADMKKAAEDKSVRLSQELEDMCAFFSDLQVCNDRLSQQVSTLQEQVSGEEKLKAAFEEFKQYEDSRVEQRCTEMDARLDALSIEFEEELAEAAFADVVSAGIAKGTSEGLRHGVEHGQAQLSLESIETYDPEAEAKYVAALQELKDLKYPLLDQLEGLKDAPMDIIMATLYLESDTGDDAPQQVRDLRPTSSQLTIHVYSEVGDPMNPWAYKEEMLLADAIAANISRAEKKKKCRIVCRTHGVGSTHHARSDSVLVFVPTVVPQGLTILLANAAT